MTTKNYYVCLRFEGRPPSQMSIKEKFLNQ